MKKLILALAMTTALTGNALAGFGSSRDQALLQNAIQNASSLEQKKIEYTLEKMKQPKLQEKAILIPPDPYISVNPDDAKMYGLEGETLQPTTKIVREQPSRYILVNIPAFMAYVVENNKIVMESKVIVGKGNSNSTKTPELNTNITHLVWNPYWAPPFRYSVSKTINGWRSDPNYMRENGLSVIRNIDHSFVPENKLTESIFRSDEYTIVQTPGDDNMLGKALFMLDNNEDIYMHDTNSRHLFDNRKRNYSLGCIRVQNWLDFASWTLDRPRHQILSEVGTGKMTFHKLEKKISVFIVYWPVDVVDGKVTFYKDLYHWVK